MIDPHPDKKHDPRVRVTFRGIAILIAILIGSSVFTAASIYARRTRLEKTTEFWGPETIAAVQLGDKVSLRRRSAEDSTPTVDLTATPGLGHLRRALLDERHYDWSTVQTSNAAERHSAASGDEPSDCVELTFSDPTLMRFPDAKLVLDLSTGFVGPLDQPRSVRLNDRVRPAMKHQLNLLMNFHQKNYDARAAEQR